DIGTSHPVIWLGRFRCSGMRTLFKVDDFPLLAIATPEQSAGPYRISASFFEDDGTLRFGINDNEWFGEPKQWDIECVGRKITVRRGAGLIALEITCWPRSCLVINRLNLKYKGVDIEVDNSNIKCNGIGFEFASANGACEMWGYENFELFYVNT